MSSHKRMCLHEADINIRQALIALKGIEILVGNFTPAEKTALDKLTEAHEALYACIKKEPATAATVTSPKDNKKPPLL